MNNSNSCNKSFKLSIKLTFEDKMSMFTKGLLDHSKVSSYLGYDLDLHGYLYIEYYNYSNDVITIKYVRMNKIYKQEEYPIDK